MLITVGTTGFDEFIEIVSSPSFAKAIAAQGFSKITVQFGSSSYMFDKTNLSEEKVVEFISS